MDPRLKSPRIPRLRRGPAGTLIRLLPVLGVVVAAIAGLALTGLVAGAWWAPFGAGLVIGVLARRARFAVPTGAATGLLAWGIPLVVEQFRYGAGPSASAIAAILGFGHQGAFAIALTLLVGVLLGVTGAWLGSSARNVVAAYVLVDGNRKQ